MRNPYEVLRIAEDASDDDVKRAYRSLAKKLHPDIAGDNRLARSYYDEVRSAYEILKDEQSRRELDTGLADSDYVTSSVSSPSAGANYGESEFGTFFAQKRSNSGTAGQSHRRGAPSGYDGMFEDFSQVPDSQGSNSQGAMWKDLFSKFAGASAGEEAGKREEIRCDIVITLEEAANGLVRRLTLDGGCYVDVTLPLGVRDGQEIMAISNVSLGDEDVRVTVRVKPHALFRLEGTDLWRDVFISLDEAILGRKIRVETLESSVVMAIASGFKGGDNMRLRGRGFPDSNGQRGDLYLVVRVVLPQGDEKLKAIAEEIRSQRPYSSDLRSE